MVAVLAMLTDIRCVSTSAPDPGFVVTVWMAAQLVVVTVSGKRLVYQTSLV